MGAGRRMITTDADGDLDLDLEKINEHDDAAGVTNYHKLYRPPAKVAEENDVETNYIDSNV